MSGAGPCWARSFSPYASFGQVPLPAVRAALRRQLERWGRPQMLRVDNGIPWGNWNDLPTAFALWVIGLGLAWHWNDPCQPQQNPKIERSQGTGKRWSEPGQCADPAHLQANWDEADRIQREEYPTAAGGSRWDVFPELRHSGQAYTEDWEAQAWSLRAVQLHLAEYIAIRKVSATGHLTVYDRGHYVGKQYAGAHVQVQYDPDRQQWLVSDLAGCELRRHLAPEITAAEIGKLSFRKKRPGKK